MEAGAPRSAIWRRRLMFAYLSQHMRTRRYARVNVPTSQHPDWDGTFDAFTVEDVEAEQAACAVADKVLSTLKRWPDCTQVGGDIYRAHEVDAVLTEYGRRLAEADALAESAVGELTALRACAEAPVGYLERAAKLSGCSWKCYAKYVSDGFDACCSNCQNIALAMVDAMIDGRSLSLTLRAEAPATDKGWQPIATAPKVPDDVIALGAYDKYGSWLVEASSWCEDPSDGEPCWLAWEYNMPPTHWTRLPAQPRVEALAPSTDSHEQRPTKAPAGDHFCQHGTAMDVHCCHCHSGFIFETDHQCEPEQP